MKGRVSFNSLRLAGLLVLGVTLVGIFGYMIIDGLSPLDALYTTVAMMTTEGMVTAPLSDAARIFTIVLMVFGVGAVLYTLVVFMEYALEGHLNLAIRRRF